MTITRVLSKLIPAISSLLFSSSIYVCPSIHPCTACRKEYTLSSYYIRTECSFLHGSTARNVCCFSNAWIENGIRIISFHSGDLGYVILFELNRMGMEMGILNGFRELKNEIDSQIYFPCLFVSCFMSCILISAIKKTRA